MGIVGSVYCYKDLIQIEVNLNCRKHIDRSLSTVMGESIDSQHTLEGDGQMAETEPANNRRFLLFGAPTGNCLRVAIGLEELGYAYEAVRIDLGAQDQRSKAYLTLTDEGKVPLLIWRDASGVLKSLTQSNAILLYLAAQAPDVLMPNRINDAHWRACERFYYFITDVIAPAAGAYQLSGVDGAGGAFLEMRAVDSLRAAERYLNDSAYMAGPAFTLADISAFTAARALRRHLDWDSLPRLRRWFDAVASRPSVMRGLKSFDAAVTPPYEYAGRVRSL